MKFLQTKHFSAFLFLITFICSSNANVAVQQNLPHVSPVNSVVSQKPLEAEQEEFSVEDYIASLQGNAQQESSVEQKKVSLGEYLYNTRSELKLEKHAFQQNWFVRKTTQAYDFIITPFKTIEKKVSYFLESQSKKLISHFLFNTITIKDLQELGMEFESFGVPKEILEQKIADGMQLPISFVAGKIYDHFLQNELLRALTSERIARLAVGSKTKYLINNDIDILFSAPQYETLLNNFKTKVKKINHRQNIDEHEKLSEICKVLRKSIAHQLYIIFDNLLPNDKHLPEFESNYKLLTQTHKGWKVLKNIMSIADKSADILALFYENIQTQYPMPRKYKMWNNIKIGFNIAEIYTDLIDNDSLFAKRMKPIKKIASLTTTIKFFVEFKEYVTRHTSYFPRTLPTTLCERTQQVRGKFWFNDNLFSMPAELPSGME